MNANRMAEAEKVFQVLTRGRGVEKEAAQNRLTGQDPTIDREYLRRLILEALNEQFDVSKASSDPGSKAWVRCWLLSTLGRIADDDPSAADYVRRHTAISNEPNGWARYWALESLAVTKAPNLEALAKGIVSNDDDPLVKKLATAIIASTGDSAALKEIQEGVNQRDWASLRALRVVPLEEAVSGICEIVASPEFSNATYDSIVALGAVPADWSNAEKAVTALITCIKECRRHPWWDAMRRKALSALHNLGSQEAVPVLVEELSDSNPSIVYEAAQALEGALGVRIATARIVEAASQTGEEAVQQYANALRWMDRDEVVEELESLMLSGSVDQQEPARALLSEVGGRAAFEKLRARANAMKQHLEVLKATEEDIRDLFDSSINEAQSGYKLATGMDITVFILGVGFVILSGFLVLQGRESLAALTGVGGALGILYNLFLASPRRRVQEAVEHLMSLKVIFLGYLRQLHQADQAYIRRFLEDPPLTPDVVRQYSDLVATTMRDAVLQVRHDSTRSPKNLPGASGRAVLPDSGQPSSNLKVTQIRREPPSTSAS